MTRPVWLHVFATFGRGGPQVRATQVMTALGSSVRHLVLAMDGRTEASELVPSAVPVELLPPPPRRGVLAAARALGTLLRTRQPDLLLTYNWGAIEAVLAARMQRFEAVVHHEEGFGPEETQRRLWRRNLARRFLLRWPFAIAVPSTGLVAIAAREWRVPQDRLRHLVNGVDLQRFHPQAGPTGAPVIGTVGGLRAEKGHAVLLRAFAQLPPTCGLHLTGDGPTRQELETLATGLGVRDRVTFQGSIADPSAAYRSFAVFALPSHTEQMPLSLLEAMASGLPVAGSAVGDVPRMLPEGSRSALVAPGDPAALARALQALLADPERRRREGAANRAHCAAHYELRACLERWLLLYRAAAAAR
jgi:glycosyltransferase involved in cell wall biosynthesis